MNKGFADRMKTTRKSFIREILKVTQQPEVISFACGLPNPGFFRWKKLQELPQRFWRRMAGMFFNTVRLKDKTFPDSYRLRKECERIHGHIKNTVKFDVRRVREESRELYSKFNFVTYQLLLLTNLRNGVRPANAFENYI